MQNWYDSDWFKEWEKLARREYHGENDCPKFGYMVSKVVEELPLIGNQTAPERESGALPVLTAKTHA